jgi:PUA domain protein
MIKIRRLRKKEIQKLIAEIRVNDDLPIETNLNKTTSVEVTKHSSGFTIYLVNGNPSYVRKNNNLFPVLSNEKLVNLLNRITVDMGAIPYICNGADVMAPGVVNVSGDFDYGVLVTIIDENHGKAIAIGKAAFNSKDIRNSEKGKVVTILHYVGDRIWHFVKELI